MISTNLFKFMALSSDVEALFLKLKTLISNV